MTGIKARLERPDYRARFATHYREVYAAMERAALNATDRASRIAKERFRNEMASAGLAGLSRAVDATSDKKQATIRRYPNGGFSASGILFVRTKSERTLGALEAYTRGADIRPVRGKWLWIPTDEIPRVSNRQRLTPELYRKNGFEQKIGPLTLVISVNGRPLLVAKNVGVNAAGKPRSARRLNKNGSPAKGQRLKEFVVAFVGIPRTQRAARVNVSQIMAQVRDELPALFEQELRKVNR